MWMHVVAAGWAGMRATLQIFSAAVATAYTRSENLKIHAIDEPANTDSLVMF